MSDWRLQGQEQYLKGAVLHRVGYTPSSPEWEHDHCEFCWQKLSLAEADVHEGYATKDGCHWICAGCYEDFRTQFGWTLD